VADRRTAATLTPVPPVLSRRTFLRGLGVGGLVVAGGRLLAACGTEAAQQAAEPRCVSEDLSATEKAIAFSNWPLYIDLSDDEKHRPTLEAFEKKTGIKVTYTEDVNDNNEFFGKVRNQLAACQSTGRDLIVVTDWMAARLIRLGWVQQLDKSKLPNVQENLREALRSPSWDKDRSYSVPWQSGLTGIAYNAKVTKEVRTMEELLTRPDLKGKVTMLSEMRDTMQLMLLSLGKNTDSFTDADFSAAIERLQKAVDSRQIRKFTGNEYAQDLAKGNIAAAVAWSGDVIQLQFKDPNIKFVAPEEGLVLWSDNVLVPNKATHKSNGEQLIDYYYDPAVAAQVAAYVNYICPVDGAQEQMQRIDPDLAKNPLIFPDQSFLSKAHIFRSLTEAEERTYDGQFQRVIGA